MLPVGHPLPAPLEARSVLMAAALVQLEALEHYEDDARVCATARAAVRLLQHLDA